MRTEEEIQARAKVLKARHDEARSRYSVHYRLAHRDGNSEGCIECRLLMDQWATAQALYILAKWTLGGRDERRIQ